MPEVTFDYNVIAPLVEAALRQAFPGEGVFLSPGYNGRVHVKLISAKSQAVSLVSAYSPDEL
jgi:hypothetical protein